MISCAQNKYFNNISSISNQKTLHRPAYSPTFKSIEREVKNSADQVQYRNNTSFFRNDLNWNRTINQIIKTNPKQIYCYACSDGSEAYSIALGLIAKLGYEEAQKYFPIIAKDIDVAIINQANSGIVKLSSTDIKEISFKLGKNTNINKYFSKIDVSSDKRECFLDTNLVNEAGEQIEPYKINDKLRKCVKFQTGDIIEDSKNPQLYNSTIFVRNVWPYFSYKQTKELLKNIKTNLTDKTTIVVGGYDVYSLAMANDYSKSFQDLLFNYSLEEVYPLIFHKHNYSENFSLLDIIRASGNDIKISILSYLDFLKKLYN